MRKRIAKMTMTWLAGFCCTLLFSVAQVSAAETDAVYIDTKETVVTEDSVQMSIQSNGKNADGVLKIEYDEDVLSIDENSVKPDEQKVKMYSVNVENGVLKISYLAEEEISSGEFIQLNFEIAPEADKEMVMAALDEVVVTGTVYNKKGTAETIKVPENTQKPENTEKPEKPDEIEKPVTNPGGGEQIPIIDPVVDTAGEKDKANKKKTDTKKTSTETEEIEETETTEALPEETEAPVETGEQENTQIPETEEETTVAVAEKKSGSGLTIALLVLTVLVLAATAVYLVKFRKINDKEEK